MSISAKMVPLLRTTSSPRGYGAPSPAGRWITACTALLVALAVLIQPAPALAVQTGGADTPAVTYSISESVSDEDAAYVTEGIALAQGYVAAYGADLPESLVVNIRGTDDTTGGGAIAFCGGSFIVVFTGSPGWLTYAPANRIQVVVHEYIHAAQYAALGDKWNTLPAWFVEGMADYLAYDAVADLGLIKPRAIRDFQGWAVSTSSDLPALGDLEAPDAFYNEFGPAYSLAGLAIADLLGDLPPETLLTFVDDAGSGRNWRLIFEQTFGRALPAFYKEFAVTRAKLIAPVRAPEAFAPAVPTVQESPVLPGRDPISMTSGDQLLIRATADPGSICHFALGDGGDMPDATGATFADAGGDLFWLVTLPDAVDRDRVEIVTECGGAPLTLEIEGDNGR
jgi:hypothetical protein